MYDDEEDYDSWQDDGRQRDALLRYDAATREWECRCWRSAELGRCPHLRIFRRTAEVKVREVYL